MNIIGIDPGLTGAIALLDGESTEHPAVVHDTPTGKDKKRSIYLPREMLSILDMMAYRPKETVVFIERIHSMPKQGIASAFNFGQGYGLWQGLVVGLGLRIEYVTPQTWMKVLFRDRPIGKDASRALAQEKWPQIADRLNLKKHHGRSDALLIAEYGRRTYGGSQ